MKSTIPKPAAALLDFIAKYESNGNYLAYYGHANSLTALPPTLDGVLTWQANYVKAGHKSSAIGRYQFMPPTLRDLMKSYSISGGEAFTSDLQDELAFYLLQRRGYDKWIAGSLTDDAFADNLSEEWASMPYHTGNSYYGGDGLNKSLVSRSSFMAAITAARTGATPEPTKEKTVTDTKTITSPGPVDFIQGLVNVAESFVAQIESTISVAVSPNNSITVSPGSSSTAGGIFSSISNAQLAVSELGQVIADAKAGKWSNEPGDVIALLKTIFSILSAFGINVPGVTQIIAMLPTLPPVTTPTGTAS